MNKKDAKIYAIIHLNKYMESPTFNSSEASNYEPEHIHEEVSPIEQQAPQIHGGRIKRFINSTIAAAAMFSAMPADNANAAEPQMPSNGQPAIEQKESSSVEIEGHIAVKEWLREFGNSDLLIGKTKVRVRSPIEQIGIYDKGQHIGDIHKPGFPPYASYNLTKEEFTSQLKSILDSHSIPYKQESPANNETSKELTIGPGVEQKVAELGMIMKHVTEALPDGKIKKIVSLSANTKNPDVNKSIMFNIDEETDGKEDTYAKIYVSPEGILTLEGKDGEIFHIEFTKDEKGEVIMKEIK